MVWFVAMLLAARIANGSLLAAAVAGNRGPSPELIDESGAIQTWVFDFDVEHGVAEGYAGAAEAPDGWHLRVVWMANPCQKSPVVRVQVEEGVLSSIVVDPGPSIPEDCDDMGVWHAIDLRTALPISREIDVQLNE